MNLGEFRELTKKLPDKVNLCLAVIWGPNICTVLDVNRIDGEKADTLRGSREIFLTAADHQCEQCGAWNFVGKSRKKAKRL